MSNWLPDGCTDEMYSTAPEDKDEPVEDDEDPMKPPAQGIQLFECEESSTVARAAYHPRSEIMRIWFRSGKTYIYTGVSKECWEKFATAPSKGKFVAESIKPRYEGIAI